MFKFLRHTADAKIYVESNSIEGIFKDSLEAINKFLGPKIKKGSKIKKIEITLPQSKFPDILIDFLSEVLLKIYIEKAIFKIKEIKFNYFLKANLEGREFESLKKEIKAVTYHQAKLEKIGNKYIAEFIVDI